jgi:hypothetical protein
MSRRRKETFRPLWVKHFPDSLRDRLWEVKTATSMHSTINDILIAAIQNGLPEIERRVLFKIPDIIKEPQDDCSYR